MYSREDYLYFINDVKSHFFFYRSLQTGSVPTVNGGGKSIGPGEIFDSKNKVFLGPQVVIDVVLDNARTSSLGPWNNSRINQQVCKVLLLTVGTVLTFKCFHV